MRVTISIDDRYGYTAEVLYIDSKQRMMKASGEKGHNDVKKYAVHSSTEADVMSQMEDWLLTEHGVCEFIKDES